MQQWILQVKVPETGTKVYLAILVSWIKISIAFFKAHHVRTGLFQNRLSIL